MKNLDKKLLRIFLKQASQKLKGNWVLLGGTLLPAVGIEVRSTVDIDIVCLSETSTSDRIQLIEIAESLGLPVESINMAAEYYFHKFYKSDSDILPLIKGKNTTIHRPTATLYLILKIQRMSESDLKDCLAMIEFAKQNKEFLSVDRILTAIATVIKTSKNLNQIERLKSLKEVIARKM